MSKLPHIILMMTDDQGWGDVGYNGNRIVKTPHLDQFATEGMRLDRFYAQAPVCSPTRASCMTGRHPFRLNIPWAGRGALPKEEISLAKALKTQGYACGHFGKWHLGQLSKTLKQTELPVEVCEEMYSPPWEHGFDTCFSTEAMMPTYNPYFHNSEACDPNKKGYAVMDKPVDFGDISGRRWRASYWRGPGQMVDEHLAGCDSSIIVDEALTFIDEAIEKEQPSFSCIWFHAPHTPVVAGTDMRELYPDLDIQQQHWYGCLSALDKQVGRVRDFLQKHNIEDHTFLWFCSDNGPSYTHDYNSAGPFKGKKGCLSEGGVRVPSIAYWPAKEIIGGESNTTVCTSDFYPTIVETLGIEFDHQPPLDGTNVLDILQGYSTKRKKALGFQSPIKEKSNIMADTKKLEIAWLKDEFKLISYNDGQSWELYNLEKDPSETNDISDEYSSLVSQMHQDCMDWLKSCSYSAAGNDYI